MQLIFDRPRDAADPGRVRTRVLTDCVVPSLHVDSKHSRIKQYHKEGRALRTETTINDTLEFALNRGLTNLSALRKVGFHASRRTPDVQRLSHDCAIAEGTMDRVHRPVIVNGRRVAGLRFLDPRVIALFCALVLFRLGPEGFTARNLRQHVAPCMSWRRTPAHRLGDVRPVAPASAWLDRPPTEAPPLLRHRHGPTPGPVPDARVGSHPAPRLGDRLARPRAEQYFAAPGIRSALNMRWTRRAPW